MESVQSQNMLLEQLLIYAAITVVIIAVIFGVRTIYKGVKQHKKWAKKAAVLVTILLVLLLIGGFIFYIYAKALGEAFSTGL